MTTLTASTVTSMNCSCGYSAAPDDARPFRCPNASLDGADHVLRRTLDVDGAADELRAAFSDREPDPFLRFRKLTHAWHVAMRAGMTDGEFVAAVLKLEKRIGEVDGRSFVPTPLYQHQALTREAGLHGDLWVKNETRNVSGSHKGRHLMGLAIWLTIAEKLDKSIARQRLAIASCGNAALAAAVMAKAMKRPLDVYVPVDVHEATVARLEKLGARVTRCPREDGIAGDPAYLFFREAVRDGALPFTCQGNENGLAIEGGQTLAWEMIAQLRQNRTELDRLIVQVGGGALASACIAAFEEAHALGLVPRLPLIHAVQTQSAHPLVRAWLRIVDRGGLQALPYAIAHRDEFMRPWHETPHSVASGILDDETYDWAAVTRGMLLSGGSPILVSERRLVEANETTRKTTGIEACPTGTAGVAGLIELLRRGEVAKNETVAVILTGIDRNAVADGPRL